VSGTLLLGQIKLPFPLPIHGSVAIGEVDATQPVPNALIRAYVFLTPEGQYSATPPTNGAVIQVAETRSDDAGRYELLIPARLDSPPPAGE
jgi:hypothetical protein